MKKLFLIIVALAWVGLSTYPAYAVEKNNDKAHSDKVENTEGQKGAAEEGDKNVGDTKSNNKNANSSKVVTETSDKIVTDSAKKSGVIPFDPILVLALIGLVAILFVLLLWFVYIKLKAKLSYQEGELQEINSKVENNVQTNTELQKEIKRCEIKLKEQEHIIATLQTEILKIKENAKAQPNSENVVIPIYQEKIWYGKYEPYKEGFSAKYLTEQKQINSQFEIRQTSDCSATFSLIKGISDDLFSGAKAACEIIEGDPSHFSRIEEINEGSLVLTGNTWNVQRPIEIKLY